jgi:dTDP-glucose 4,6-dehydratase
MNPARSLGAAALPEADFQGLDGAALEALRGARLFITGGTGFIGAWLLEYLYRQDRDRPLGLDLLLLSRDPARFLAAHPHYAAWPALAMVAGDVRRLDGLELRADAILHGATPASAALNAASPLEMIAIIAGGTAQVLALARRCGARRLLFLSSGLASGVQPPELEAMTEDQNGRLDALDPAAAYGNAKHFAEHLCLQHGREAGLEVVIARCYAFVGPLLPLDAHFAVGNFMRDGLAGEPIRILGDGTPLRSYLHAAELSHWLWTLLVRGRAGQAYNVGAAEPVSIRQLAEHIGRLCRVPVRVARPAGSGLPARYVPCIAKIQEELALTPRLAWQEAVARTLAWHRACRAGGAA